MRAAQLALLCAVQAGGCTKPIPLVADLPAETHHDAVRFYSIWLGGSRVGTARESEIWSNDGVTLKREEKMLFLRADTPVSMTTTIEIDADSALVAHRVRWTERTGEDARATERAAEASHALGTSEWSVSTGEHIDGASVPAELAPLIVRRDGHFDGRVFLPARGFVAGSGRIEPIAPGRLIAHLDLNASVVEATIDLDGDGMPARIVDGEGVIARRVNEAQAAEWFPAVDLISATSIPIDGPPPTAGRFASTGARDAANTGARDAANTGARDTNSGARANQHRITLVGDLALPAVPGQQARVSPTGVEVLLDPSFTGDMPAGSDDPRDRTSDIRTLVAAVRLRISPDLGAGRSSTRDVDTATAGDCTTFALAYAALASRRAIPTRVVTGLRVDVGPHGARLVRHRWAVSWTGSRWIAIDAAFGAVPAGGNLIGLAVHDADDAGLVAGEAALTQVSGASWTSAN